MPSIEIHVNLKNKRPFIFNVPNYYITVRVRASSPASGLWIKEKLNKEVSRLASLAF